MLVDTAHMRHCIDYLRESLLCAADTNMEPLEMELKGVTGWGGPRKCRDIASVNAWTEQWLPQNQTAMIWSYTGDTELHCLSLQINPLKLPIGAKSCCPKSICIGEIPIETPISSRLFYGQPRKCYKYLPMFYGTAISNMIIDLIIITLPWPMIWRLQMPTRQKFAVGGIFTLGAL